MESYYWPISIMHRTTACRMSYQAQGEHHDTEAARKSDADFLLDFVLRIWIMHSTTACRMSYQAKGEHYDTIMIQKYA